MAEFVAPSDEAFSGEVLAGIEGVDSLSVFELTVALDEASGTDPKQGASTYVEDRLANMNGLSERERRMVMLDTILTVGMEYHTTIFGKHVTITRTQDSGPLPPKPDTAGDREPRVPRTPSPVDTIALELP